VPLIARLALVFASGAVAGAFLSNLTNLVIICVAACALLLTIAHDREHVLLLALGTCAIALGALHAERARAGCTRVADGAPIDVSGVLETLPTELQRTVRLRLAKNVFCGGGVRVRMPESSPFLHMGDPVRVLGSWMTLRVATDGRPATDGIVIARSVRAAPDQRGDFLLRARGRAQERIQELFPMAFSLAEALLIAQRENLNPEVRESFAASGLTHLLAISGTHVALVAAVLLLMARLLRCTRVTAALVSILGSAAYVFFLGAPHAALRALIQMTLLLASRSMQRPAHPLGLLAAAAVAITIIDPAAPLDAGFQLSFAGICGIVLWRRPLIDLLPTSLPTPVCDAIATTCAATAITSPIAGFHFGVVSVIALVANLLAIPVVSLAVPTAAAALVVSAVSVDAARFIAGGAELTLIWLYQIAHKCALVPGGHFAVTPTGVIVSSAAVTMVFVILRDRVRSTLAGRVLTASMAGMVLLVAVPLLPLTDRSLQIHMIDVGQGDAFAIRSPRGRWLLVDAGPKSQRFDAGKRTVLPFLLRHQASHLAAVIVSHPHLDHFGGVAAVIDKLRVGVILDAAMPVANRDFDSLLAVIQQRKIPWTAARTGDVVQMDGMRLEFIAPDSVAIDATADPNDYSLAFRLSYGAFTALFLGDMPTATESRLMQRFRERMDVDLLKVSHHGSRGSSSEEFIVAASPRVALISAGRRNHYGHPNSRVVAQLQAHGARVFRSDEDGTVSVLVTARGDLMVRTGE
jgi:competence protein ComEC